MTEPHMDDAALDALAFKAMGGGVPVEPPDPDEAPSLDEGLILAWQAGQLDEHTSARVEAALAADPEARAVALALAELNASPELVDDVMHRALESQKPKAIWRWPTAMAAAAALAIGVWWGQQEQRLPGPDYASGPLLGAAQVYRGPDQPQTTSPVYLPSNTLMVKLRPATPQSAPKVHIFGAFEGGQLEVLSDHVVEPVEGGGLIISAPASGLFGDRFGPWRLHVVLGDVPEGLGRRGEAEVDARARSSGTTWMSFDLRYAPTLKTDEVEP
ncbi:MAG: hypothetical protein ACE366_28635 [Bradymonadia bacterium]